MEWDARQQQALDALCQGNHIFLSGKAGSGKSTLLREFCTVVKDTVVCAPTGLAALNIGGTTIHSLFELPIIHASDSSDQEDDELIVTRISPELLNAQPLSESRRKVLRRINTVVIDEISQVRADVFDAIDWRLREATESKEAFGGKQIVVVGDFMQLGPVVRRNPSRTAVPSEPVYAFQSVAWQNLGFKKIFLSNIYRQQPSDQFYYKLLNAIRYGNSAALNAWNPSGETLLTCLNRLGCSRADRSCLCLCPTNRIADEINRQELNKLSGAPVMFTARISGDFPDEYYPTAEQLELKVGMRVMLLVNVRTPSNAGFLYVNGDLAVITAIQSDEIQVILERTGQAISVEPMAWDNIEYRVENEHVVAVNVGSFRQLPLRPAYALSVHKAQGLTVSQLKFVRGKGCFAHGQLYVALSRCPTFDGLALESPIQNSDLIVDEAVKEFEMYLEFLPSHYLNHAIHFLIGYDSPELSPMALVQAIWTNYQQTWPNKVPDYIRNIWGDWFDEENSTAEALLDAGRTTDLDELKYAVDEEWAAGLQFCRDTAHLWRDTAQRSNDAP